MNTKTDVLTMEDARQLLADEVPGFVAILSEALDISISDLFRRIERGEITRLATISALAQFAIDYRQRELAAITP